MAEVVYILCTLTSVACALLLLRGFGRSGMRLMLWSGLCFLGLTINNALLFFDSALFPTFDLSLWRSFAAMIGLALLLYGMIWEAE